MKFFVILFYQVPVPTNHATWCIILFLKLIFIPKITHSLYYHHMFWTSEVHKFGKSWFCTLWTLLLLLSSRPKCHHTPSNPLCRCQSCRTAVLECKNSVYVVSYRSNICVFVSLDGNIAVTITRRVIFPVESFDTVFSSDSSACRHVFPRSITVFTCSLVGCLSLFWKFFAVPWVSKRSYSCLVVSVKSLRSLLFWNLLFQFQVIRLTSFTHIIRHVNGHIGSFRSVSQFNGSWPGMYTSCSDE